MSPVRIVELPTPFPHQQEILLDDHRIKIVDAGRQFGKTLLGSIAALDGHGPLVNGLPMFKGALHGVEVAWVTKDFPTATKIWRDIKGYLSKWGAELQKSEQEKRIDFPGGGALILKSAHEPDALRSFTFGALVGDETGFWHPEALSTLKPSLAVKKAWQLHISTPFGFNWFFEEWRKGNEKTDPEYRSWGPLPSSLNPAFPREEFERARATERPGVFAREYLAQFNISEGEIFRREWFNHYSQDEAQIIPDVGPAVAKSELQTYMAADFALTQKDYSDYTAIAVVSADKTGRMFMRELIRAKVSRAELPQLMARTQDRWGAVFTYVESSGELANLNEECRKAGVRIRERKIHQKFDGKKGEDKVTRAHEASKAVELGKIMFPKLKQPNGSFSPATWVGDLVAECCAFPEAKGAGVDDRVDALSLSVLAYPFLSWRGEGPGRTYARRADGDDEDRGRGGGWLIGR